MFRSAVVVLWLLSSLTARSQSRSAPPSFEVADVKVNQSGEMRLAIDFLPGGKLSMRNVPMKVMIVMAYHVRPDAVTGGPGWLESDRFDVVAKASPDTSQADLRRMLQALLAERFKLQIHTEPKILPAYALVLAKSGPKLERADAAPVTDQRCGPGDGPVEQKHVICQHITMAVLADTLQEIASRDIDVPVVDQTGLAGSYNFKLDWTPAAVSSTGDSAGTAPVGPTLFDAVEAQLGLKLERRKLPLPVIVVDRVERVPVEN